MDPQGNRIIAVDFDKTISMETWPEVGKPNNKVIEWIKKQKLNGSRIILHTCRTGNELKLAENFCKEQGIEFDAINANLPDMIEAYGDDPRKISADIYLDDKALRPEELNSKPKGIITIIQEACEDMCNNYCKYKEKSWKDNNEISEECKCCPLNRLL